MPSPTLLAVEGGGGTVPVVILLIALAGFALAYFVVGPGRRRGPRRHADIPLAMRPYHSDEELETSGLERAMAWGVALAVFSAIFLPLYWLIEPDRQTRAVDEQYQHDVERGREEFQNACAACHGVNLEGGSAPHPDPDIDTAWPAPRLDNIVARFHESEIVEDVPRYIRDTATWGRPGTPMPEFGTAAGGSLSDFQIDAIVAYILSVQTGELPDAEAFEGASGDDVFDNNCARCHGDQAQGAVGPQLLNVYERFGGDPDDPESMETARAAVRDAIEEGRWVPGTAAMPPFGRMLSDDAIEAVLDHLEELQETGGPRAGQLGGDPAPGDDDAED
jgi:cbb3-type cytochrome c oxidase subunit III